MLKQKGYTLIELIVVSVIIFILAAVACPIYKAYQAMEASSVTDKS